MTRRVFQRCLADVARLGLIPLAFWSLNLKAELSEIVVVSSRDSFGQLTVVKPVEAVEMETGVYGGTVADLLGGIPGVDLNGQGGSLQAYSIRGFSRARIKTYVAGVPLNTERRAGNSATFIDPFLVQRISVLKGPASALYGSGAIGGIVSLQPQTFRTAVATASYYSQGDQTMIGAGWGNDAFSAGVAYRKHQRSRTVAGSELNDGMDRVSGSFQWSEEYEKFSIKSDVIVSSGRDIGKSSADFPDRRVTNYPDEDHLLASIQVESEAWLLGGYVHEQALDTSINRPGVRTDITRSESTDYGANVLRQWHKKNSIFRIGLELDARRDVRVEEKAVSPVSEIKHLALTGDQFNSAFFVDSQWMYSDLIIHAGLRYSRIEQEGFDDSDGDDAWTGTVSFNYSFTNHWEAFAQLGSGFRFPELTEKFFNGTTGRGIVIGAPGLEAEQSVGSELGITGEYNRVRFQSSIYHSQVENYIERIEVADRLFTYRNLQDGDIKGVEFSLGFEVNPQWNLQISGHWMEGKDDQGRYLADMSSPRVNLAVYYRQPWGHFTVDYRRRFESDKVHPDEVPTDQYKRLSVSVVISIGDSSEVAIWANNGLDDDFRATSDSLSPRSSGRGIGASFTWHQ